MAESTALQRAVWSIRSALYVLFLALTVIPYALAVVFLSIFIRGNRLYWFTIVWLNLATWGAKAICGVRHRMLGLDNLAIADKAGPIVLCPKHQSAWETFAFPGLMPHPLAYVFKRELLYIPFFGWAMGRLDMIHIDRKQKSRAWAKVSRQGQQFMKQGNWVIMFPEGTRAERGGQEPYKSGASRLAIGAGASILPIAVTSARCWPRKSFMLRPGVVDVSVGPLIASAGRRPDEMMAEVEAWIEAEMRRLDPAAYIDKPGSAP